MNRESLLELTLIEIDVSADLSCMSTTQNLSNKQVCITVRQRFGKAINKKTTNEVQIQQLKSKRNLQNDKY